MKTTLALATLLGFAAVNAQAVTVGVDLSQGGFESNTAIIHAEGTEVAVGAGEVTVDYAVGTNLSVGDTVSGVNQFQAGVDLAAGLYNSFLIHFDPLTASGSDIQTFDFDTDIVAIIVSNGAGSGNVADGTTDQLLNISDLVFGVGDTYEQTISRRSEGNDSITLLSGNSLTVDLRTSGNFIDNVRVITEVAAVPVPASLPLLLAGFGGLAALRKRRKAA